MSGDNNLNLETISQAARQGVTIAGNLLTRSGELMRDLLANIVSVFDPQKIILAGKLSQAPDHPHLIGGLEPSCLKHLVSMRTKTLEIDYSCLGSDISLRGAGALVFEKMLSAHPAQLPPSQVSSRK